MPFALFSELIEKQSAGNVNAVLTDLDGALQLDPKQKRHGTSSSFSLGTASKQAASTTSFGDAKLESDKKLQSDALRLKDLAAAASKARHGSLVIVDACRDDLFVEA